MINYKVMRQPRELLRRPEQVMRTIQYAYFIRRDCISHGRLRNISGILSALRLRRILFHFPEEPRALRKMMGTFSCRPAKFR